MKFLLEDYTQVNPALNPDSLKGISDIATIWNGQGTFSENLIEYSGRVCYRSTAKMGKAPNFIAKRLKDRHEDIIEHVVVSVRVWDEHSPEIWLRMNPHCHISVAQGDGDYIFSANLRVWLDFFRRNCFLGAVPILKMIAPKIFAEFDGEPATESFRPGYHQYCDDIWLMPVEVGNARVTLLAFSQPFQSWGHGNATFLIEGVSRACTHQFVRHRLASFSQESQRYVDLGKGGWNPVIPPSVEKNPDMARVMQNAWNNLESAYSEMRAAGIRKEDARFLLPNAAETRLVVSMNFKAWDHFLWLRALDKAAQWEIRQVGQVILELFHAVNDHLFTEHWDRYVTDFHDVYSENKSKIHAKLDES